MDHPIILIAIFLGCLFICGFVFYKRFIHSPSFKKCPRCSCPSPGQKADPATPPDPMQLPFVNKTHITHYAGGWVFKCPQCSFLFDRNGTELHLDYLKL